MTERLMTPQLQEWEDAVNAATADALNPHAVRMESAGRVLARDYVRLLERANAEASLAVRLRQKLEEVAGPDVASSVV